MEEPIEEDAEEPEKEAAEDEAEVEEEDEDSKDKPKTKKVKSSFSREFNKPNKCVWFGHIIPLFVLRLYHVWSSLKVEKTVWDWELMNDIKPIWQRPAKEVEEDEYKAFYKTFSKVGT